MEISPERRESIKTSLSLFMGEEETKRFLDLSYALTLLKKEQTPWQAIISIGVYIAELYLWGETEAEKAILKDITDYSLEPLEALIESLTPESGKGAVIKDERDHLLFHARFALGFLLLAKGKKDRAKGILHEMAATELSVRGNEFRSGSGIVKWTPDIAMGKLQTAIYLIAEYGPQEEYEELLYLMTEAIACNSSSSVLIFLAPKFLDKWAAKCEKEDDSREYDFPSVNWLDLFVAAADILSVCQESDSSGAHPDECKKESSQFLAWNFGQMVGRFAYGDSRWRDNPFEKVSNPKLLAGHTYEYGGEQFYRMWQVVLVLASLLSEYDLKRDWRKLREHYVEMWGEAYTYRGTSLAEVGPESDLYWAMRLGFADKIFELTKQLPSVKVPESVLETIITPTSLRTVKILQIVQEEQAWLRRIEQQVEQRLPPSDSAVLQNLQQHLSNLWDSLPSDVTDKLLEAEEDYQIGTRTRSVILSFGLAVEACFNCYFTDVLVDYMKEEDVSDMILKIGQEGEFRLIRIGTSRKAGLRNPRILSLREWAGLFEMLMVPSQKDQDNLPMKVFIKKKWPKLNMADLKMLVKPFKEVQEYRNKAAHPQPPRSHLKEKKELVSIRNLVLGINGPSVIAQIFQLLNDKSSS